MVWARVEPTRVVLLYRGSVDGLRRWLAAVRLLGGARELAVWMALARH